MRLSKHFTLQEMTFSQKAARLGINNAPSREEINNLRNVCNFILEPVRVHYNKAITPSSGYRGEVLNIAVGGSENSQHRQGEAVDFSVPTIPNLEVCQWIIENVEFDQLILEYPSSNPFSGWIHCSYNGDKNRGEVLTKTRQGYSEGLNDEII